MLQLVAFKASSTGDSTAPSVSITAPQANAEVSGIIAVTANATGDVGVAGVQFLVDNVNTGVEDATAPYGLSWDTRTLANDTHTLTARVRDAAGNTSLSAPVAVTVNNTNRFRTRSSPASSTCRPTSSSCPTAHAGCGAPRHEQGPPAATDARQEERADRVDCERRFPGLASFQKCAFDIYLALQVLGQRPATLSDGRPLRALVAGHRPPRGIWRRPSWPVPISVLSI